MEHALEMKKTIRQGISGPSFLPFIRKIPVADLQVPRDIPGGTSRDHDFRYLGKVPVKGCGLTAAAGSYQRIELFDNTKALRVLRILIVPLIVEILLNDLVDDLIDSVCEGVFPLRDTDPCSLCLRV